jgi:hypothetical protein
MWKSKVFISFCREDGGHAARLWEDLSERLGKDRVFRDVADIELGISREEAMERALSGGAVLLVVIGPHWRTGTDARGLHLDDPGNQVRREITRALARGLRVIPVLVQRATLPAPEELPEDLRLVVERKPVELSEARWNYDVGRLATSLGGRTEGGRAFTAKGLDPVQIGIGVVAFLLLVIPVALAGPGFGWLLAFIAGTVYFWLRRTGTRPYWRAALVGCAVAGILVGLSPAS